MHPELQRRIDEDLDRLVAAMDQLAPRARAVLAGSVAWNEPCAWREEGDWQIASDLDLFLIHPSPRSVIRLRRDPTLPGLGRQLRLRLALDPTVLWRPLLDHGAQGLVGKDLRSGERVSWPASAAALRINLARKCLLRSRLMAPREHGMRRWYQVVKAVIEGVRAAILLAEPGFPDHALFSVRGDRAAIDRIDIPQLQAAQQVLDARLAPEGLQHSPSLEAAAGAFLEAFRTQVVPRLLDDPARRPAATTTVRAWWALLRNGLLPDPRVDYDRALTALLADSLLAVETPRPELYLAPWRPGAHRALPRALDGALRNPLNTKCDDLLWVSGAGT